MAAKGYTLIEIMVATLLAATLAIGMQALYAMLSEEIQDFTLRQKAVFALNSEMEKLYSLFHGSTNATTVRDTSATLTLDAGYANTFPGHLITGTGSSHYVLDGDSGLVVSTAADFQTEANRDKTFFYTPSAGVTSSRNVVWLDFEKKITARVSWLATRLASQDCFLNDFCYVVTLYLDYPFRYDTGTNDPLTDMGGRVNTLVLRTLVGPWNQS